MKNAIKSKIKNASKKTFILIVIFYILFSSLFANLAQAVGVTDMTDAKAELTAERAGNYVSNFAINFYNNFKKKVNYSESDLDSAYNGNVTSKYAMSNTSWIAFAYNQSLGLSNNSNFSSYGLNCSNYVQPHTKTEQATWSNIFEQIRFNGDAYLVDESTTTEGETKKEVGSLNIADLASSDSIQPGDILIRSKYDENEEKSSTETEGNTTEEATQETNTVEEYKGYVYLYIGAGQVIYCHQSEEDNGLELQKIYIDELPYKIDTVLRIKEDVAAKIMDSDVTMIFAGKGFDPEISYQGIPGQGTYLGTTNAGDFFKWLIAKLADVADYLVGIVTYALKAIIIGWTNLIENLVHYVILGGKEEANGTYVNTITGESNNLDRRVSIEDIIFNKIPIFDVNFFNFEQAGGSEIDSDSVVAIIRENIAKWYYIIRSISIVVMLLILIYVGIKIALSSIADKKAQYKSALTGWVVGFLAIVCLHLFMYIVFQINEYFVTMFENTALQINGGELSLYETIRTKSYSARFTEGFGCTIIYMFLVWLLIKYAIVYFKRYLTVTILGIIGPIMGLKYGIERATGKKTQALTKWMFDFAMNVLVQSIHALLYVILITIAMSMAFESIAGFVVAIVILNFMLQADKIFMKIFSFDRAKSVGDTIQHEGLIQQFAKYTVGVELIKRTTVRFGKGIYTVGSTGLNVVNNSLDIMNDNKPGRTAELQKQFIYKNLGNVGRRLNKITGDRISSIAALSLLKGTDESKKMDKLAMEALRVNMQIKKKQFTRAVGAGKTALGGAYSIMLGIPTTVADPMAGIGMIASGVSSINKNVDKQKIEQVRIDAAYGENVKTKAKGVKKVAKAIAAVPVGTTKIAGNAAGMGMGQIAVSAKYDLNQMEDESMKNHKVIEQLKKGEATEKEIDKLYKELKEVSKQNGKDINEINKEFGAIAIEAKTKRVTNKTISKAISEYMNNNTLTHLSELDVEAIMNIVKRKEQEAGKTLVFEDNALDNIRDTLRSSIEKKNARKSRTIASRQEVQSAFQKGLAKNGSIKSEKVQTNVPNKTEEIKAKIQEKVREYQNTYESSGGKIESTGTMLNRVEKNNQENNN